VGDQPPEKRHFFDKPQNVRLVLRGLFVACGLVLFLDLLDLVLPFELRHAEEPWEGFPGFYAAFGFVACVVLVLLAKRLRGILMRKEDYYDR